VVESEFRKDQMRIQEDRDKRDNDRKGFVVCQLKQYGGAIHNAVIKMGSNPIDLIPFFDTLLKPYVN
jgi:hypothetical protein